MKLPLKDPKNAQIPENRLANKLVVPVILSKWTIVNINFFY